MAQEVEQSLTKWKVGGLIPGNCSLHVVVSLGKKLRPNCSWWLFSWCMHAFEWLSLLMCRWHLAGTGEVWVKDDVLAEK